MQTAVEWLEQQLFNKLGKFTKGDIEQAKEMEKQQIMDAFDEGQEYEYQYHINNTPKFDSQTYYAETYGSKGSHKSSNNCDTSSQTEISDEEIYKQADKEFRHFEDEDKDIWIRACQWYREQLKKKQ